MTRAELENRVEALARAHTGQEFVEAVQALAAPLDDETRVVLGDVLLARAGDGSGFEALARARERRWRWLRLGSRARGRAGRGR